MKLQHHVQGLQCFIFHSDTLYLSYLGKGINGDVTMIMVLVLGLDELIKF